MKYCPYCSTVLDDNAVQCHVCGFINQQYYQQPQQNYQQTYQQYQQQNYNRQQNPYARSYYQQPAAQQYYQQNNPQSGYNGAQQYVSQNYQQYRYPYANGYPQQYNSAQSMSYSGADNAGAADVNMNTRAQGSSGNESGVKINVWRICIAVGLVLVWLLLFGKDTLNFISNTLTALSPGKTYVLNLEKSEHMIEAFGYSAESFKEELGDTDCPKIKIMEEYVSGDLKIRFSGPDVFDAWSKIHVVERDFLLSYDETVDGVKRYFTYEENMKKYYWFVYDDHITYGNSILYFD